MLGWIDVIFLIFAYMSLFFSFLFLVLFIKNRNRITKTNTLLSIPSVSILIPAYNEEKNIANTIRCVKKLIYPKGKLEVMVIDDGSTDRTYEIAKKLGIRVLRKQNQGKKAFALNYGLKHAKGELIACMDADSMPQSNSLMHAVKFFADEKVGAVTTSIFVRKPRNFIGLLQKIEYAMIVWTRKMLEYMESIYVTPGPLSVYRKSALNNVGGFDENNVTEDIEIAWRLLKEGYKIRMSTKSIVYTNIPYAFGAWWKQRLRWNIGGLQTTNKYKAGLFNRSYGTLGTFVIPFFSLSFIVSLLGFGIFVYLIGNWVYKFLSFSIVASSVGVSPIQHFELFYLPDLFTFFGIAILILSLVGIKIGLTIANKKITGVKGMFGLLIYISLYITIFPIILIHSFIRMGKGKTKW
ncbi:MAG: glycosyltransferase [Candidatus Aenigmarchaeota archaeon]|nr:glycosyltransferase [Candidatus Aenigmarchaeota archaeon]